MAIIYVSTSSILSPSLISSHQNHASISLQSHSSLILFHPNNVMTPQYIMCMCICLPFFDAAQENRQKEAKSWEYKLAPIVNGYIYPCPCKRPDDQASRFSEFSQQQNYKNSFKVDFCRPRLMQKSSKFLFLSQSPHRPGLPTGLKLSY